MITSEHLIDGIAPDGVVMPANDDEIAEVLIQARDEEWVLPLGGGTAVTTGNVVDRVPILMDLSSIRGIIEYEPADLTASVRAGTPWSDLIAELAEHGQTIPVDVPFPEIATVGGVVATGWAGPRQLRDGTMKDLLIGASFVRGDGLAAKAGGMVVKNVSGFEIPRLLHGSYGSLAVITSVNLKIVPKNEGELTLRFGAMAFSDTVRDVLQLTRSEPSIAAAVVDGDGENAELAIRLSGRHKPIRELAAKICSLYGDALMEEHLEDDHSANFWQGRSDELAGAYHDRVIIEVGCPPADVAGVIVSLGPELTGVQQAKYHVSPGTGSVVLDFPATAMSWRGWSSCWEGIDAASRARFMVLHAPRSWRSGAQIWSIPEGQRTIMASLKQQFDPEHRLNRGRLWDVAPDASVATPGRT